MKPMNFARTFWAALLAFVVANIALGILSVLMFASMIAALSISSLSSSTPAMVYDGSILKIDLSETITDSPSRTISEFNVSEFKVRTPLNLLAVLEAIDAASYDSRIEGIFITGGGGGIASSEELRDALEAFRESGKFIVAYNEYYGQRDYYISSVASPVLLHPEGMIEWYGISSSTMFVKGLLEKIGVEPVVIRHGSYKAAVEPFILDRMSPENRLQMTTLVNSIWGHLVGGVAASRGIDSMELVNYASDLALNTSEDAVRTRMADSLVYMDRVYPLLNRMASGDDEDNPHEPSFVTLRQYINASTSSGRVSKDRVALIYADGDIVDGESRDHVGGATVAQKLAKVRHDYRTKAVVLRINSPGGSAMASDVMWREVELLKKEKPVIVSMGSVAASGGYYMACGADVILADKTTITGSIGVFGLMMNASRGLKDKLGITVDVVKTNPSADMRGIFRGPTAAEERFLQNHVEKVYNTFVNHVAEGRNLRYEEVDAVGGGRVWSGIDAKQIGLVDGFGGIRDAIALAADRAGISEDYSIYQVTDKEDPFAALLRALSEGKTARMEAELGELYTHYRLMNAALKQTGVQARMPYTVDWQ